MPKTVASMSASELRELDRLFRLESERVISDDWVVRYENRLFQLQPQSRHYAPARGKVLVSEGRHGSIAIEYRGRALRWHEIPAPARLKVREAQRRVEPVSAPSAPRGKRQWMPPTDPPW